MKGRFSGLWRLLKPHARPRLPALAVVVVFASITAAMQAGVIVLFKPIWDLVLFPAEEAAGTADVASAVGATQQVEASQDGLTELCLELGAWVSQTFSIADEREAILVLLVVVSLVMALLAGATQYGCTWLSRRISYQMIVDLRVRLARHLMGLSVRYHGERRFGDLLSRVSSDVTTTLHAVQVAFKGLLQEPLLALASLVTAFLIAPWPTLGVVVILPLIAWPISKLAANVRRGSKKSLTSLGASVQALTQMFQGIRTVKAFGAEEREIEGYRKINLKYLRVSMRMVRAIAMTHAWTALYSIAGVSLLAGAFGFLIIRYDLFAGGGQMSAFFLLIARLNNHVKNMTRAITRVQESVGASVRIFELLDEPSEVVERPDAKHIEAIREGIRLEGLSFTYPGSDEPALSGIDLEIRPGETLALVGASGAGKSTLIDLVARFFDPTEGRISIDGVDLRELAVADWIALYALVGQVPFLFHASIGDNIHYGRPDASQEEVEKAARAADIHDFICSLPEGYETDVADMGSRLSGGQRQRITIARALLKGAPLLLLDEATSALDSHSEAEVQRALERLMADRTVIVIAHRLSTIRRADRIAVLRDGALIELGSHEELVARGGAYARMSSLQAMAGEQEADGQGAVPPGPDA